MNVKYTIAMLTMLGTAMLASCQTPEQRAAEVTRLNNYDDQQCQQLGFRPGTEPYGNCRLKMREIRAQEGASNPGPNFSFGLGVAHGF
jgi:hypothetical protein